MRRKKLPEEYQSPIDLEAVANFARSGEMPVGRALAMLHRSAKLSQEIIDAIAHDALQGYQWDAIAARVGIAPRTLSSWLKRGKAKREEIDDWYDRRRTIDDDAPDEVVIEEIGPPPIEDDLVVLYDSCARAHANAECNLVDVIRQDAMLGNVSSAKWLLQSRFSSWNGRGRLPAHEDANPESVDAASELNTAIVAFAARAAAIAAASSVGSD